MPFFTYLDNDSSSSPSSEDTSLLPTTSTTNSRTPPGTCTTSRISRLTTTLNVIAQDVSLRLSHALSTLFSLFLLRPLVILGRCLTRSTQKSDPDSGNFLPFTIHSSLLSHSDPGIPPTSSTSTLHPLFSPPSQPNHSPSSLPTPNARNHFLSTHTDPTTSTSTSTSLSSSPSSITFPSPPFSIHSLRSALKKKNSTSSSTTLLALEHEPDAESSSSSSSTPNGTVTTNSASATATSSGLSTPIPIDIPGVSGNTAARKSVRFTDEDDWRVFEVESWEAREKRTSGSGGLGKWKKVGKTIVWQDGPERDYDFSSSRMRGVNDDKDADDDDEWWSNSFLYSWFLPAPSSSSSSLLYPSRSSFLGSSPPGGRRSSSFIASYADEMRLRDGLF